MFPHPSFVLSASRDATVRLWKLLSNNPPKYDCSISTHGSAFINAVAYLPPSSAYPDGLIVSGGKDTIIEVRQPGKPPEENAEALLLGHASNVCALDVSVEGGWVVSGSWDASARVWRVGKWECDALLEGHEGSVWDVLAYDRDTIITGRSERLLCFVTHVLIDCPRQRAPTSSSASLTPRASYFIPSRVTRMLCVLSAEYLRGILQKPILLRPATMVSYGYGGLEDARSASY